jgi:arylsulfatase A
VKYRSNGIYLGQKTDAWEGGHRVPFLARWPGHIPAGTTSTHLLSLIDLFKTCLAAAAVPCPTDAGPDSINQLPVLLSPTTAAPVRRGMVYGSGRALRVDQWVYLSKAGSMGQFGTGYMKALDFTNNDFTPEGTLKPDAAPAQLYRLSADPQQSMNLYRQYPDVARAMDEALTKILNDRRSNRPIEPFLPAQNALTPKP